jgi:heme exporter protein D
VSRPLSHYALGVFGWLATTGTLAESVAAIAVAMVLRRARAVALLLQRQARQAAKRRNPTNCRARRSGLGTWQMLMVLRRTWPVRSSSTKWPQMVRRISEPSLPVPVACRFKALRVARLRTVVELGRPAEPLAQPRTVSPAHARGLPGRPLPPALRLLGEPWVAIRLFVLEVGHGSRGSVRPPPMSSIRSR